MQQLLKDIRGALNTSSKQIDDWMHMKAHKAGGPLPGNGALHKFYREQKKMGNKPPLYWMSK